MRLSQSAMSSFIACSCSLCSQPQLSCQVRSAVDVANSHLQVRSPSGIPKLAMAVVASAAAGRGRAIVSCCHGIPLKLFESCCADGYVLNWLIGLIKADKSHSNWAKMARTEPGLDEVTVDPNSNRIFDHLHGVWLEEDVEELHCICNEPNDGRVMACCDKVIARHSKPRLRPACSSLRALV